MVTDMTETHNTIKAMLALAQQLPADPQSLVQSYMCYWIAFTSLAWRLARETGLNPTFGLRQNGTLRTRKEGDLKLAEIYPPTDKAILDRAARSFTTDTKHALIVHPSTHFFVNRTPTWNGESLKYDAYHQKLNGVVNISSTLDPRYPAWCPIDRTLHTHYIHNATPGKAQDHLAHQIVEILHVLYRNLLYAGPETKGENTTEVIEAGLGLLCEAITHQIK